MAYDMFSWYKCLIVNLVFFPTSFLQWESLSDCAFPDCCLLVPFHIPHTDMDENPEDKFIYD